GRCNPRHGRTSTWLCRGRCCIASEKANPSNSVKSLAAQFPGWGLASLFLAAVEAGLTRPAPRYLFLLLAFPVRRRRPMLGGVGLAPRLPVLHPATVVRR